ncbi:MAG: S4 domain-containing protein, partial [Rikenellaceae bacterium]
MAIRLNRYLSESGFCSRREADGIIAEGRVTINGVHGEFHSRVTPEDVVAIDGERIMPRRKIDFTPKEAPKPHRSTRREPEKQPWVDKVPQWLKEIREKKPDLTPQRALVEKKETPKPKSKATAKPSASKSGTTN